ncbi:hypothetical protein [Streptomyces sp. NBC_01803]|uniref:hypothetical protein n=1 Tax=Streptomyces sp. NBC_01803 TaxID=2975946 RepID=UPI002DDBF57E|nr:hypothetical protein [Streptomyces sp. NBC_01803]WSA44520.1 hypothetical protein OIE51_10070 [Streptomyces sp. NBC_01803]
MRIPRIPLPLTAVSVFTLGLLAVPQTAQAQIPVLCSESSLVTAINMANAEGGDTLALAPFCTYRLTSAHGDAGNGAVGLPPITTPITLLGIGVTIVRDPSAPDFRILEVDGGVNVPGADGDLTLVGVTVSGGSAVEPYPGGGIANFGGSVSVLSSSVTNNTAVAGGGIYTDRGTVSLNASDVSGNRADTGGGIYENSGSVSLFLTTVSGNSPDNCAPAGSVPGCSG